MVQPLEGLKDATKDLNHIDRSDIYYQLLLSYIKQDDPEKALGLWTQMQDEDIPPADEFLVKLGAFLNEKGHNVPFVVPKTEVALKKSTQTTYRQTQSSEKPLNIFRQALKNNDLNTALELSKTNELTNSDQSLLIEKLAQNDRTQEASAIAKEMLQRNNAPLTRIFKFLLNKLASNGDMKQLQEFSDKMSSDLKKNVSFDNRLCHANLVAGKAKEYLNKLEDDVDKANDQDLPTIAEKFPRGGAVGILEKHPELLDKCK